MASIGVRPLNHSGEEYTLGNWRFSDSIPCWTWPGHEGKTTQIEVFSEGSEVELICAGTTQRKALVNYRADFEGSYVPGVLTAISYDSEGNEIARAELKTTNNETVLCVEPEESELTDLVFVPISLRDSNRSCFLLFTESLPAHQHTVGIHELEGHHIIRQESHRLPDGIGNRNPPLIADNSEYLHPRNPPHRDP